MDQEPRPREQTAMCLRLWKASRLGPGQGRERPRRAGQRPLLCGGRGVTGLGGAQNGAWDGPPPLSSYLGFTSQSFDWFLFTVTERRACAPSAAPNHDVQLTGKCCRSLEMAET